MWSLTWFIFIWICGNTLNSLSSRLKPWRKWMKIMFRIMQRRFLPSKKMMMMDLQEYMTNNPDVMLMQSCWTKKAKHGCHLLTTLTQCFISLPNAGWKCWYRSPFTLENTVPDPRVWCLLTRLQHGLAWHRSADFALIFMIRWSSCFATHWAVWKQMGWIQKSVLGVTGLKKEKKKILWKWNILLWSWVKGETVFPPGFGLSKSTFW